MALSEPHSAPPPVPTEGVQTPELRLESELLSMIGTFIAEKVDTTGDIKIAPADWLAILKQFSIVPPMLLKIIPLNPGTYGPGIPGLEVIAEALSKFIYDITKDTQDSDSRGKLAGMFFECTNLDQLDGQLAQLMPEVANPVNNEALGMTIYFYNTFGKFEPHCYRLQPRSIVSRWTTERYSDQATAAFYECGVNTGSQALQKMEKLNGNGNIFDRNHLKRFRIKKREIETRWCL